MKIASRIGDLLRRKIPHRALGPMGERRAAWYLRLRGYRVLERNFRWGDGEIDLIVRRGRRVAFVEVKTRQQTAKGTPAEAVDRRKQLQIGRLAERYLTAHALPGCSLHFDVISLFWDGWRFRLAHVKDAFVLEAVPGTPWRTR